MKKNLCKLNVFTNSSGLPGLFGILKKTVNSFEECFVKKGKKIPMTVWVDPLPDKGAFPEYIEKLKKDFEDVRETKGLADGYLQSLEEDYEYLFQLEHDWAFDKEKIVDSLPKILTAMKKGSIPFLRFNMRPNVVQLGDTELEEVCFNGVKMCKTPGYSNNPHIIDRKLYRKFFKRFICLDGGPHGIEECIPKDKTVGKKFIYGPFEHPSTIIHLDGRKSIPKQAPQKELPKDPGWFLWSFMPYAPRFMDMDMGTVDNKYMKVLGKKDWAIFIDHDCHVTTDDWYLQIWDIIEEFGESFSLFTGMTNRWAGPAGAPHIFEDMKDCHGVLENCSFGRRVANDHWGEVWRWDGPFNFVSGNFFALSAEAWEQMKGFAPGFFGVDTNLFNACRKMKGVGLMLGVYTYHKYRAGSGVSHVRRAWKLHPNAFNHPKPSVCGTSTFKKRIVG